MACTWATLATTTTRIRLPRYYKRMSSKRWRQPIRLRKMTALPFHNETTRRLVDCYRERRSDGCMARALVASTKAPTGSATTPACRAMHVDSGFYGDDGALECARYWVPKHAYWFDVWPEAGCPYNFDFSPDQLAEIAEPAPFGADGRIWP